MCALEAMISLCTRTELALMGGFWKPHVQIETLYSHAGNRVGGEREVKGGGGIQGGRVRDGWKRVVMRSYKNTLMYFRLEERLPVFSLV